MTRTAQELEVSKHGGENMSKRAAESMDVDKGKAVDSDSAISLVASSLRACDFNTAHRDLRCCCVCGCQ